MVLLKHKEKEKNNMAQITTYANIEEYGKYQNKTREEFKNSIKNGYIQTLTLGTYNGASHEFTPWEQIPENIWNEVTQYLMETSQGFDNSSINEFMENEHLFIISETNDLYLED